MALREEQRTRTLYTTKMITAIRNRLSNERSSCVSPTETTIRVERKNSIKIHFLQTAETFRQNCPIVQTGFQLTAPGVWVAMHIWFILR
uniref:Uncharacterized protein n=1 Tax=Ascaris lumbricoides TaxID=6252 RepID=A0A0M3I9W4_ASCLU